MESIGRVERYGGWGIIKVLLKTLSMYLSDRRSRRYLGGEAGAVFRDLPNVVGYGVIAGRKG